MDTIKVNEDSRGVAVVTLARGEKHNAMSDTMISELTEVANSLGKSQSVRAVVLTGEGRSFCAGADLAWMRAQLEADQDTRAIEARRLAMMLKALNEMPKPLIGRIQGQAFGGGLGLMSVCDVAIGVEDARFAFTETRLGLIPATIGPYVIARMGEAMARRVFMSARGFDAKEAVRLGLLSKSVPDAELDHAIDAEVAPYLSTAPGAVSAAKQLAQELGGGVNEKAIETSITALLDVWAKKEAPEGVAAFFDRRKPDWAQK